MVTAVYQLVWTKGSVSNSAVLSAISPRDCGRRVAQEAVTAGSGSAVNRPSLVTIMLNGRNWICKSGEFSPGRERTKAPACAAADDSNPLPRRRYCTTLAGAASYAHGGMVRGAGIGRNQIVLNEWSIAAGGHARVSKTMFGSSRDTLAPSNAALVKRRCGPL